MEIEWSPLALERVVEPVEYIALDKPNVAVEWASQIFDSTEKLKNKGDATPFYAEMMKKGVGIPKKVASPLQVNRY